MFDKTYTKVVDSGKLWTEIEGTFPDIKDVHTFVEGGLDKVHIEFDEDKDGTEEATLDSIVNAHVPVDLEDLKSKRNALIDERTKELIFAGYVHDNNTFSLSEHAQRNWIAIATNFTANLAVLRKQNPSLTHEQAYDTVEGSMFASPGLAVSTLDDLEYVFSTFSDFIDFFNAAYAFANGHYMSGRGLKDQINNASSEAELNAIVDNR